MKSILIFLTILINFSLVAAESASEKGLRIVNEIKKHNDGFIGESSTMKLILINAFGDRVVREMKGKILEVEKDGDKSLIEFFNPKDVKGTKMLTWSHKDKDDDQWLYLPSVRRVKRISSRNKSSSFMGSEFSYEDLGSQEISKYTYEFLKDAKEAGKDVKCDIFSLVHYVKVARYQSSLA